MQYGKHLCGKDRSVLTIRVFRYLEELTHSVPPEFHGTWKDSEKVPVLDWRGIDPEQFSRNVARAVDSLHKIGLPGKAVGAGLEIVYPETVEYGRSLCEQQGQCKDPAGEFIEQIGSEVPKVIDVLELADAIEKAGKADADQLAREAINQLPSLLLQAGFSTIAADAEHQIGRIDNRIRFLDDDFIAQEPLYQQRFRLELQIEIAKALEQLAQPGCARIEAPGNLLKGVLAVLERERKRVEEVERKIEQLERNAADDRVIEGLAALKLLVVQHKDRVRGWQKELAPLEKAVPWWVLAASLTTLFAAAIEKEGEAEEEPEEDAEGPHDDDAPPDEGNAPTSRLQVRPRPGMAMQVRNDTRPCRKTPLQASSLK